ncbi:hypothetical protein WJX75_004967 [Coccomyxa subellipsoidea]|uniref:Uncharacterized protein n=1 Tax=Coccomyxa subellipsoidea TaxID=248742 RepID=A0ABR2YHZ0_9CHLO
MFKSVLQEHNGRKADLRRQSDKANNAAIASAEALTSSLVEAVDSEVSKAFELEKQLSKEAKEARALAVRFKDQTSTWIVAARRADATASGPPRGPRSPRFDLGLECPALCSVVRDVTSLSETAGVRLVLAELDGCCYMLRPDLLLARVADRCAVRWISFAANGHGTCCHWATEAESEAVHKQLVAVTEALQLFCERGCASEKEVFRLGALSGAPIMPTLSGWMLGYPVAYLVDAANVGAAASWLSCADLALHRVNAVCSQLQRAVAKVGSISASSRADLDVLCSFTVPAELLSGGGADLDHRLEGWVKGIAGGMGGSGIVNRILTATPRAAALRTSNWQNKFYTGYLWELRGATQGVQQREFSST